MVRVARVLAAVAVPVVGTALLCIWWGDDGLLAPGHPTAMISFAFVGFSFLVAEMGARPLMWLIFAIYLPMALVVQFYVGIWACPL